MMKKVVTFGELLLRLSPENYLRFVQSAKYEATFGGAEANVAVSLANYGMDVAFVTKLPAHEIGQAAVNALREFGVDTSRIVRGGERVGIYYCEKGASQRPSKVIYDRAYSAIAMAKKEDFDWDKIFDGADWFHFSGIVVALGGELSEICLDACKEAKKRKITVSCDINYRKTLWIEETAKMGLEKLFPYVDYCKDIFYFGADEKEISKEKTISVVKEMVEKYNFKGVAVTFRETKSANDNNWSGMLYRKNEMYYSKRYAMHVVDRVGGGDAFMGGLIYALMNEYEPQRVIEFAVAASCLKHSIEGDYNMVSVAEVMNLAGGNASGRVQR